MNKKLLFNQDVRKKIMEGVDIVANAVVSTLGPRGSNVIFSESSFPTITKDGVTVARQVFLKDKFQNMGVMLAREAAENTNREAGDGTTTTIVLLRDILKSGYKAIASGMNPILLKRGMDKVLKNIVDILDKNSKTDISEEDKFRIASISANNDEEIGKLVVDVVGKVGVDGIVSVATSNSLTTQLDYIKGIKLKAGYENHMFINNAKKLQCDISNPVIIICTDAINMQSQLIPIVQSVLQSGKKEMILLADKIEGQAMAFLVQNFLQGKFTCVPVKVPSFGSYQQDLIYDLATSVNATVFSENGEKKIEEGVVDNCGTARQVSVGMDNTVFTGTTGNIKHRVDEVKALLKKEKDTFKIEKLKDRLGRLTGSVAHIQVGGASESEQSEKKDRIEDSLNATKAAILEGIVEGGGTALLKCHKGLEPHGEAEDYIGQKIVLNSLLSPLKVIADNSGKSGEAVVGKVLDHNKGYNALTDKYEDLFKAGVIDPKKVVRCALQNAIATAGILLTNSCGIVIIDEKK